MTKAPALGVAIGDSADAHLPSPFRSDVSLAEYMYYARLQREEEQLRASGQSIRSATPESTSKDDAEKGPTTLDHDYPAAAADDGLASPQFDGLSAAQRRVTHELLKLRNTEWKGVLFLICCDILGPFNAPYAIAQMGLVPGVILYIVMGMTAFWGAMLLLMLFLKLDSARYPLRTYGDLATRLLGPWMGGIAIALQAIQLVINVGIICLSNGQALSQIVTGSGRTMCFSLAVSVTMFLGMITGQIRTLRNVGHFATASVGLNIVICLMCMIGAAKYGPNIAAAQAAFGEDYPWSNGTPVIIEAFVSTPLQATLVGLGNAVFAFGGASIFLEILSEMKNPRDFWKSALIGQSLILVVYLVMATTVYSKQGQFSMPAAYLGLNSYGLQTAANAMSIVTLSIAALLYGNIGLKVLYKLVVEGALKGPTLSTRRGRMLWSPLIIVYWGLAFVIGSSIPQLGGLTAVLGFVCIGAFSFAFPFQFTLTYFLKRDAQLPEEAFEPGRESVTVDSWVSASRWRRAITTGDVDLTLGLRAKPFLVHGTWVKVLLLVCCLASYALAGLGLYGTVLALADAFSGGGAATSFGCAAPS